MNCNIVVLEQCQTNWEATKGNYLYDDDYNALHEQSISDDSAAIQDTNNDNNNDNDADGNDNNEMESVETTESNRVNARVLHEMRCLSSWFNPIANKVID